MGFIWYISRDNLKDLDSLIALYKKNADVLRVVAFTILRKSPSDVEEQEKSPVRWKSIHDLVSNKVKELFGLEYCALSEKNEIERCRLGLWAFFYTGIIPRWDQSIKKWQNHTKKRCIEKQADIPLYL